MIDLLHPSSFRFGATVAALWIISSSTAISAPTVPTDIQQPGTQPGEVGTFISPDNCDNCHGNITQPTNPGLEREREPGFGWRGGMMGNAGRDPLFWATLAVAEQDFIPNADPNQRGGAGDLCIRCHTRVGGWIAQRSTPPDGSGLSQSSDKDGVECEFCHLLVNPDPPINVAGTTEVQNAPFQAYDPAPSNEPYRGSGQYVQSEQVIRRTFKDFSRPISRSHSCSARAPSGRTSMCPSTPAAWETGVLDLVPKKAGAAMLKLRLHTDEAGRISRMIVFDRSGNPYVGRDGRDWPDNALRFGTLCRVDSEIALGHTGLGWQPELVHANDWQTGLIAPFLADIAGRPATLFTIHNLSYQGLFDRPTFDALGLPAHWWSPEGVEFYSHLSFIKGGITRSDIVTTVSPTYAAEIRQPGQGYGLHGLLGHRADRLFGILNGIDYALWNPQTDPMIPHHFGAARFHDKGPNKTRLQQAFGLEERNDVVLFGHIGRLVEQKGIDLILAVLPRLMAKPDAQLAILGSGNAVLEELIRAAAAQISSCFINQSYDSRRINLTHQRITEVKLWLKSSCKKLTIVQPLLDFYCVDNLGFIGFSSIIKPLALPFSNDVRDILLFTEFS